MEGGAESFEEIPVVGCKFRGDGGECLLTGEYPLDGDTLLIGEYILGGDFCLCGEEEHLAGECLLGGDWVLIGE